MFEMFSMHLGFNIIPFDMLFLNRITLTFNNIKPLMKMLCHYYHIHKLLSNSDIL